MAAASTALAALSTRLTDTIASVELQRSSLEEVILTLSEQATALNAVASVLTNATHAQGHVLQELQQLLSTSGAPAQLSSALKPATSSLAHAAGMLAQSGPSAPTPPAVQQDASCASLQTFASASSTGAASTTSEGVNPGLGFAPHSASAGADAVASGGFASFDDVPPAAPPPNSLAAGGSSHDAAPFTAAWPEPQQPVAPAGRDRSHTMAATYGRPARTVPVVIEPDIDDIGGVEYVSNLRVGGALAASARASAKAAGCPHTLACPPPPTACTP